MSAPRYRPVKADSYVSSPFGMRTGQYAGMHYGTDFGLKGGAAGMPVYAAQAGTVIYAGAARGFGGPAPAGWVVLDHDDSQGSGATVYGHIIAEVRVGQRVNAGDRIGRVNPSSATNGKVVPHLHFEVCPREYRAGSQIDPVAWLGNAPSPDGPNRTEPEVTTPASTSAIFGVDVSVHQNGMSLKRAAAEGFQFAIIRTTDGTYKDTVYRSHLDDAESAGLVTAAYHFLRRPSEGTTIAQQVQASLEVMGDAKRPVWLDCETPAGLHVDDIRECKRLYEAAGVRVIGCYSYVPFWEGKIDPGEPDSHEFGAFWVAAYGPGSGRAGYASATYPGDSDSQWNYPLGNQRPVLWQFSSKAPVAGFDKVDVNAFRGTKEKIRALFYGGTVEPTPAPEAPDTADPSRPMPVFPEASQVPTEDTPAEDTPTEDTPAEEPEQRKRTVLEVILAAIAQLIVGPDPRT